MGQRPPRLVRQRALEHIHLRHPPPPDHQRALERIIRTAPIPELEHTIRTVRLRGQGHRTIRIQALVAATRMARIREQERVTRMVLRTAREHGHRTIRIRALVAAARMARIREQEHAIQTDPAEAIGQAPITTALTIRESGLNLRVEATRLQPGTAMPFAPAPTAG
jgi:hypothetical protein